MTRRRPSISTKRWPGTRTEGWPRSILLRELYVPATALQHFEEDTARARAILAHADPLRRTNAAEQLLRSDLLRSSWMFAVGAMDAYFCDAYTDIVAATASSKTRQPAITLPEWAYDIKIPIRAVLEEYDNANWRWRMAARKMMERENVISLSAIQTLFNKFFRRGHKFFRDPLDTWMSRPDAKIRLFGVTRADYLAMNNADKHAAREAAGPTTAWPHRRVVLPISLRDLIFQKGSRCASSRQSRASRRR